tara:strand:+ start:3337 stop:4050 length:714 start_codon:yes stop_codon:yes gene_type:complete
MIPKIIHQCWYGLEGPLPENPHYHEGKRITENLHPDWNVILWNKETSRQLVKEHFPFYLPFYDNFRYEIQRMDFDRFVYLYVYGGFYIDLDVHPLKSLEPLRDRELILHSSDNFIPSQKTYTNNFMASKPNHPLWKTLIQECFNNYTEKNHNKIYDEWKGRFVLQTTGPNFMTRVLKRVLPKYQKDYLVYIPERIMKEFDLPLTNENIENYYLIDQMNRGWMDEIGIKNNKKTTLKI